jgi:L-lactate dehydrogenase complex protein LldG
VPENIAHPAPPPTATAPLLRYSTVDPDDLAGSFAKALTEVAGEVHRVEGDAVPADLLERILATLPERTAVVSTDPEAEAVGRTLVELGVEVSPYARATGAAAALGVTGAVAAIAATGSVVQDSTRSGGRGASLLPGVHLCVVAASRLVATPGDVLRVLTNDTLPSNLVFITGPSRTGDIEQLITLGVHGPTAVHVVLLEGA